MPRGVLFNHGSPVACAIFRAKVMKICFSFQSSLPFGFGYLDVLVVICLMHRSRFLCINMKSSKRDRPRAWANEMDAEVKEKLIKENFHVK